MIFALAGLFLIARADTTIIENTDQKKEDDHKISGGKPMTKSSYPFFLGTYTNGKSEGIYKYVFHTDGSFTALGLAIKTENPSCLAQSPDNQFLLAVNEIDKGTGAGTVESYAYSGDRLELLSRSSSGGNNPCFVSVNKDGFVLAANYTGGNVGLLKLNEAGVLSELLDVQQHHGSGTTDRQEAPHAHSAWFEPGGAGIISIDLGTNELWFSRIDETKGKFIPAKPSKLELEPGAGPRHLAYHPEGLWLYVLNELNSTVTLLQKDVKGLYQIKQSFSTLPEGYSEPNTAADIHISSDGKFVYVSNRGHDSIAVFQVSFQEGALKLMGHKSTGGKGPRNFAFSPDQNYLVVANQYSDNIVSLKRDNGTGMLKYKNQIKAPSPVCIEFLR